MPAPIPKSEAVRLCRVARVWVVEREVSVGSFGGWRVYMNGESGISKEAEETPGERAPRQWWAGCVSPTEE